MRCAIPLPRSFTFFIFVFFLSSIPFSKVALAVPAFAKQLNSECTLCHVGFPKLNEFGTKFRANGYRMEGDTGKYIWEQPQTLGFVGSVHYENVNMEMEMEGDADHDEDAEAGDHDEDADGGGMAMRSGSAKPSVNAEMGEMDDMDEGSMKMETKTSKFDVGSLLIYSAGTLAPRVSYFAHMVAGEEATTMALYNFSLMDIVPEAGLNVRLGEMSVDLPFLSSTRRLTIMDYLIQLGAGGGHGGHGGGAVTMCSACGATFTNTGAELNGMRDYDAYSFQYAFGAGNDSVHEADDNIGAYHGLAYLNWEGHSLGFIYRHDRTGETEAARQNADGYGVSVDVNFAGANLMGSYNWFKHGMAMGSDMKVNSGAIEAMYPLMENLLGVARYDFNDVQDSDEETTQLVASLIWYSHPNIKFQIEYAQSKHTNSSGTDFDSSGVFAAATAGF